MAKRANKIIVTVTPGRNAPIDNVIRLEDLLREMTAAPPKRARGRPAAAPGGAAPAGGLQQLAIELEARLREARAVKDERPRSARRAARGEKK